MHLKNLWAREGMRGVVRNRVISKGLSNFLIKNVRLIFGLWERE